MLVLSTSVEEEEEVNMNVSCSVDDVIEVLSNGVVVCDMVVE